MLGVSCIPHCFQARWRSLQDLADSRPSRTAADSTTMPSHTGHNLSKCRHTRRYGSEAGLEELRESIAGAFYGDTVIKPSEIFVSDGSKCDIGRLQMMFGSQASVALQVWPLATGQPSLSQGSGRCRGRTPGTPCGTSSSMGSSGGHRVVWCMCHCLFACGARNFELVYVTCLQDPAYPVYVDSSVIMGMTGDYNAGSTGFDGIQYMPCSPDNDFFPDLSKVGKPAVLASWRPCIQHTDT